MLVLFNTLEESCRYENYVQYIKAKIMDRSADMVLFHRSSSLIRGNTTAWDKRYSPSTQTEEIESAWEDLMDTSNQMQDSLASLLKEDPEFAVPA